MTVDRELLAARIAKIREYLRYLDRLRRLPLEAYRASTTEQHASEREMQVVVEACLDIGHHVIAREGLRRPGDYRDVFVVLREAGIIDVELGSRLEDMASFRNRLVHGYVDIDPDRVYTMARGELADVETFVAVIVNRFIGGG